MKTYIRGYVGYKGGGKTSSMVRDSLKCLKRDIRIVSNTPLKWKGKNTFFKEGKSFFEDMLENENTLYLLDEGGVILSKYNWKEFDQKYHFNLIMQRKYGNYLFFTSPNYEDIATQIKQHTEIVVQCKKVTYPFLAFSNIYYDRIYFEYKKQDLPVDFEKQFIKKRKLISTLKAGEAFKYYDTKYCVNPFLHKVDIRQPSKKADEDIIGSLI